MQLTFLHQIRNLTGCGWLGSYFNNPQIAMEEEDTFALIPGQGFAGTLDHSMIEARNFCATAVKPLELDNQFDITPKGLHFLKMMEKRANNMGWSKWIQAQEGHKRAGKGQEDGSGKSVRFNKALVSLMDVDEE